MRIHIYRIGVFLCIFGVYVSKVEDVTAQPSPGLSIPDPSFLKRSKPLKTRRSKKLENLQPRHTTSGTKTMPSFRLLKEGPSSKRQKGKKTKVTFDRALPEDISNENFPDKVESFDFPNAGLSDLANAISKLTGMNFIVAPGLESKRVSIIAPSPITVAEAYKAFLATLAANDYTVVKSGAFWKIQPTAKSHKDNTEVYSGDYFPNTEQLITRIIKLKHINATNFMNDIKWLISKDNQISAFESSNSILLSDYGSVVERIMKIVYEMDVPDFEEKMYIVPIEHAAAENVADILSQLMSVRSSPRRRPSGTSSFKSRRRKPPLNLSSTKSSGGNLTVKVSSIIPDPRTNSLVILANKKGMDKIKFLIEKIDAPVDPSRMGGVYVYNVLYGAAADVYNTLMGIKPSEPKAKTSSSTSSKFGTGQFRSRFADRNRTRSTTSSGKSPLFENVTIMADSNTNSLIISAKNKDDYDRVKAVLKKIDVPRDQVFIQAIIVEMIVNKDNDRDINLASPVFVALQQIFGDELFGEDTFFHNVFGSSVAGFLTQSFGADSIRRAALGPGLVLGVHALSFIDGIVKAGKESKPNENKISVSNNPELIRNLADNLSGDDKRTLLRNLGQSAGAISPERFAILPLFRLLNSVDNANILSTPHVTTLDNVEAVISVGGREPVSLSTTTGFGSNVSQNVKYEDVLLSLTITPRINQKSGTVQMTIDQAFDDISPKKPEASELSGKAVRILKRKIKTEMVLHDGETAVLGGLLTDKEVRSEDKIPILGDIPVLGWLFKGTSKGIEKRNLLVFLTPTIIKGREQKKKTREIVGKKLTERIQFIKKYMKGRDPYGESLEDLISNAKSVFEKHRMDKKQKKWFWQKRKSSKQKNNEQKNAVSTDQQSSDVSDDSNADRQVKDEESVFNQQILDEAENSDSIQQDSGFFNNNNAFQEAGDGESVFNRKKEDEDFSFIQQDDSLDSDETKDKQTVKEKRGNGKNDKSGMESQESIKSSEIKTKEQVSKTGEEKTQKEDQTDIPVYSLDLSDLRSEKRPLKEQLPLMDEDVTGDKKSDTAVILTNGDSTISTTNDQKSKAAEPANKQEKRNQTLSQKVINDEDSTDEEP